MTDVNTMTRLVQQQLAQAGIDAADAEARLIVAHVLQVSLGQLGVLRALGEELSKTAVVAITELATARATRIPLQHLTGVAHFYGLDLRVEPGVFIPRPETELLVETTLAQLAHHAGPLKIMDLCTGSGAIAAALAHQLSLHKIDHHIWAVELSEHSARIAHDNTQQYNVTVLCGDATDAGSMLSAAPELGQAQGTFDAVVSNPPYIPTTTPVTQLEAVQDPDLALYGGSDDGTQIPTIIAAQAEQWVAPGGFFMMEHDHSHAATLLQTLSASGAWLDLETVNDLTGTPRFVTAIRADLPQPTTKPH